MKPHIKLLLLLGTFGISYLVLFSQLIKVTEEQSIPYSSTRISTQFITGSPTRLIIPSINVNAAVQELGITTQGDMAVPDNAADVGWFKLGPQPGDTGSAVIAGHFDDVTGKAGVFTNLHKLKIGDQVIIENNIGKTFIYIVRGSRLFKPGVVNGVFDQTDIPHLNLITCDGVWDHNKKSYSERLVVFTDIVTL